MQKNVTTIILSIAAIWFLGCDGNSHNTVNSLDTKSIYSITGDDKLVIHIQGDDSNSSQNTPDTSADGDDNGSAGGSQTPIPHVTANGETTFVTVHIGEPVFFSAAGSEDPDGVIEKYVWTDMDENVLSTDPDFTRTFYTHGIYEKTLTVIDDQNNSASEHVCILADITADEIPLIAHTGPDIYTTDDLPVIVEGRAICKSGNFSYEWREGDQLLSSELTLAHRFDAGEHAVRFKITDNDTGSYAMHTMQITVTPAPSPAGT